MTKLWIYENHIAGFHMTSLTPRKFTLQNYRSYGEFTFIVY